MPSVIIYSILYTQSNNSIVCVTLRSHLKAFSLGLVYFKNITSFRGKEAKPEVCVCVCMCFLTVQETTPLQCTEALRSWLWGWCEQGGRELKEGRNDGGWEGVRQFCYCFRMLLPLCFTLNLFLPFFFKKHKSELCVAFRHFISSFSWWRHKWIGNTAAQLH